MSSVSATDRPHPTSRSGPGPAVAVVAVSARGAAVAARLAASLPAAMAYVPARFLRTAAGANTSFGTLELCGYEGRVAPLLAGLFATRRALVLVMAVGAAVRLVAPLLQSKRSDPAVVVVDDAARFAVSLLSGHLGGANDLAQRVAGLLGATAVVTTASESAGAPAADLIGHEEGWTVEPGSALTRVAAALVNGEVVGFVQDAGSRRWLSGKPRPRVVEFPSLEALAEARPAGAIVVSDRRLDLPAEIRDRAAIYRPPVLYLGVGCSRGASNAEIAALVDATLDQEGLSSLAVAAVATIDRKAAEPGLLEFVRGRGWPLRTFSAAELDQAPGDWARSEVVRRAVGAAGVAEPAALLAAQTATLVSSKTKSRTVTVAIARSSVAPCPVEFSAMEM